LNVSNFGPKSRRHVPAAANHGGSGQEGIQLLKQISDIVAGSEENVNSSVHVLSANDSQRFPAS
jgi:hypothetical protein